MDLNELYKKLQHYLLESIEILAEESDIWEDFEDIVFQKIFRKCFKITFWFYSIKFNIF